MPIYEYQCKKCHSEFEVLVRNGQVVTCPDCDSAELVKKFSAFAMVNSGPQLVPCQAGETCASCEPGEGGGSCPLSNQRRW
jgi:putative FmdB family regulatory protein